MFGNVPQPSVIQTAIECTTCGSTDIQTQAALAKAGWEQHAHGINSCPECVVMYAERRKLHDILGVS